MTDLSPEQVEALASAVHIASSECRHADIVDAPCERWADALAPTVAAMLAERERALQERIEAVLPSCGHEESERHLAVRLCTTCAVLIALATPTTEDQ